MEKDVRTMRNIMVANAVVWVLLVVGSIALALWTRHKEAKADEEEETEKTVSGPAAPVSTLSLP